MHTQNRIDLQIIFHISDDIKWIIKRFRSSPPILIKRINKTGKIRMNKKLIIHNLNSKCYHCINHRTVINNLELFKFETINACACVFFFLCHMHKACRFQSVSQLIVEALFVEALGLLVVVRQVLTYL
ncbi:hypothetical protein T12_16944 [Trichinella patagoniensis]|uniref:Uncharacterized protein n=1 Tax=Trichinella patagoniensis TaxID=990121 RepID=A0A0V0ZKP2_9BILA|nr:hypothetical protein T12_16944 [Trichinella patagoniensis]